MEQEKFHLKKIQEQSPRLSENVLLQKIENAKKSLESLEGRVETAENPGQKAALGAQIRNIENQLVDYNTQLSQLEREDGSGHA